MSDEVIEAGGVEGGENNNPEPQPWLTSVPEPLRGHEAFKGLAKQSDVFQKFVDLSEKSNGSVTIPGDKATDEERAAFYTKLGRPEAADKYSFTKPEDLPADIPYSPELETAFKQFAHKINLTDAQAKELYNWYHKDLVIPAHAKANEDSAATAAAQKAELDKSINTLKDVWKGDEFKVNVDTAFRAFKAVAGKAEISEEATKFLEDTKVNGISLGNHPVFLKMFAAIGKTITDDSFSSEKGGNKGELSDEEKAKAMFPKTYPKT